jgi:hypothetical protein
MTVGVAILLFIYFVSLSVIIESLLQKFSRVSSTFPGALFPTFIFQLLSCPFWHFHFEDLNFPLNVFVLSNVVKTEFP